eukprot:1156989-Amphidinium_carterae.2
MHIGAWFHIASAKPSSLQVLRLMILPEPAALPESWQCFQQAPQSAGFPDGLRRAQYVTFCLQES